MFLNWQSNLTPTQTSICVAFTLILLGFCTGTWCVFWSFLLFLPLGRLTADLILKRTTFFNSVVLLSVIDFVEDTVDKLKNLVTRNEVERKRPEDKYQVDGNHVTEAHQYIEFIVRDFIEVWYSLISREESVLEESREELEELSATALQRLAQVDVHIALEKYIVLYRHHLCGYQEAFSYWKQQPSYRRKQGNRHNLSKMEFKRKSLEEAFELKVGFHNAMRDQETELLYLRCATDALLKVLVPQQMFSCSSAKNLIQEILTCNVLYKIVDLVSQPHWLHWALIMLTSDEELLLTASKETEQAQSQRSEETVSWSSSGENSYSCSESTEYYHQSGQAAQDTREQQTTSSLREDTDITGFTKDCTNCGQDLQQSRLEAKEHTLKSSMEDSSKAPDDDCSKSYVTMDLGKHFHISESEKDGQRQLQDSSRPSACASEDHMSNIRNDPCIKGQDEKDSFSSINCSVLHEPSYLKDHGLHEHDPSKHGKIEHGFSKVEKSEAILRGMRRHSAEEPLRDIGVFEKPVFFLQEDSISVGSNSSSLSGDVDMQFGHRFSPEGEASPLSQTVNKEMERAFQASKDGKPKVEQSRSGISISSVPDESQELTSGCSVEQDSHKCDDREKVTPAEDVVAGMDMSTPTILFEEVTLPITESAREPGGTGRYTLYVIHFIAWYKNYSTGGWEKRSGIVKRRYREFVTLHERLEEHPVYQYTIKGVKGPSRWSGFPFASLDQLQVESRRRFLEKYLQNLRVKVDINHSLAMKEFLAYGGDANIAFVKKAPEIPRFDQVIVRTVSGMFNILSTALPSSKSEGNLRLPAGLKDAQIRHQDVDITGWQDEHGIHLQYDMLHINHLNLHTFESTLAKCIKKSSRYKPYRDCSSSDEEPDGAEDEFRDAMDVNLFAALPRPQGDGCDNTTLQANTGSLAEEACIPLSVAILDLAVQTANQKELWVCQKTSIQAFKVLIGQALQWWLHSELEEASSAQRCVYYLNLLRNTLWPNGKLDTEPTLYPSEEQRQTTRKQARRCLFEFFPKIIPVLVGHDDLDYCVDQVMASIDHPKLNRHFAYCLLDLLMETVIPEVCTARLQQELLSQSWKQ